MRQWEDGNTGRHNCREEAIQAEPVTGYMLNRTADDLLQLKPLSVRTTGQLAVFQS